ncbi:MAG: VOC family protein [Flavobacteriaceae bacterium]|nr:VOC family protein [Flavobacteriaceae bacterium]
MEHNMVGWFEVPVLDMGRAVKFYNDVFQIKISVHDMGPLTMGWFPFTEDQNRPGAAGSLVLHKESYKPSSDKGVLIYFSSRTGNLEDELGRIEVAGGKILQPKTQISEEYGFMALFIDSEGNRIALISRN